MIRVAITQYGGISSIGRALGCGSKGYEFKSRMSPNSAV